MPFSLFLDVSACTARGLTFPREVPGVQLGPGSWEAFKKLQLLLTARIQGLREPDRAATRSHKLLESFLNPVLHGTPVGVWVEKAVHRLKSIRKRSQVSSAR